jgi:LysR family transcriptional regulator, glycine cleavage system transcriptional activator
MSAHLPPLNACRAFEAAARLGSFARAATELNVTPTAISHHIKVLEAWTGRRLFKRRNNSITPTAEAQHLAPLITAALEQLAGGVQSIMGVKGPTTLTISAQPDFALKWLIPRLPRFAERHRSVELRIVSSYRALDLINEDIDVAVRYLDYSATGRSSAAPEMSHDLQIDLLLRADLSPVAHPAMFPRGSPADPEILERSTLLHVLGSPEDWRNWLEAADVRGVNTAKGPKFESYALSGEAAAQKWGVAMGRIGFIEADLAAGRLIAPFALKLASHRSWFLLTTRRTSKPQVAMLRTWMLEEAAGTTQHIDMVDGD